MIGTVFAKYLRPVTVALGLLGFALRQLLYALAADEWGLLPRLHPLELGLWALTAAALALIVATVWGLDGSPRYRHNFSPSLPAALGHLAAAVGIAGTVALTQPPMDGGLGTVWRVLGLGAVGCLAAAGTARFHGKRPFFLTHMTVCLFLVVHLVNQYRGWSADPQLLDYVYSLFGQVALMFFAYYTACFDVGLGRRRMQLGMGLTAVYLNLVSMGDGYPWLRLGCVVWVLTDLCTFSPRPKPPKEESEQTPNGPA